MKLNTKKILYVAVNDGLGVENKIKGFCKAAEGEGYVVEIIVKACSRLHERRLLMQNLLTTDAKYIVLRSMSSYSLFFLAYMMKARMQGKTIIVDQPSPMWNYAKELNNYPRSYFWKLSKKTFTYIGGPLFFLLSNRIVQYADESAWFKMFCRDKTLLTGNGIDVDRIVLRQKKYPNGCDKLALVGVAACLWNWHGYDRVIRAMGEWKRENRKPIVTFDIVGNDMVPDGHDLKELAMKEGVGDMVRFHGFQSSEFLEDLYSRSTLAVASLGLFRKGLSTSSVLKTREYCLAGIPFIATGYDPDFPSEIPFRFEVSNDDSIDDILMVFKCYCEKSDSFSDEVIRQYAIDHLSYKKKFKEIMRGL